MTEPAPGYIDADTHVDESEETWSYLSGGDAQFAPVNIEIDPANVPPWLTNPSAGALDPLSRFWFIDGLLYVRRIRSDLIGSTEDTRELRDVALRLKHMDELNVAAQVIYPTLFLQEVTLRPEVQVALYKSYNRFVAERCESTSGRLRWVAMVPFASPSDALEEMLWAKEHGAVGVFKRGVEGLDRAAADPWFFPAYELAAQLNLPVCIHTGSAFEPPVGRTTSTPRGHHQNFDLFKAFTALVARAIPARFPGLRFGFIENCAAWTPHLLRVTGASRKGETLASLNFFVTAEADEDIPYIASRAGGEDNLFIGTDYSHTDRAAQREAHKLVVERGDLREDQMRKLTSDNARAFYAF